MMTSDEIKAYILKSQPGSPRRISSGFWLREMAYQLAVMNDGYRTEAGKLLAENTELRNRIKNLERLANSELPQKDADSAPGKSQTICGQCLQDITGTDHRGKCPESPEGFEAPILGGGSIHRYRRGHPQNRFCCLCGAGEHHPIHDIPAHFQRPQPLEPEQKGGRQTKENEEHVSQPQWTPNGPIEGNKE